MGRLRDREPWLWEILESTLLLLDAAREAVEDERHPNVPMAIDDLAHALLELPAPDDLPPRARETFHKHASEVLHALAFYACSLRHDCNERHVAAPPGVN